MSGAQHATHCSPVARLRRALLRQQTSASLANACIIPASRLCPPPPPPAPRRGQPTSGSRLTQLGRLQPATITINWCALLCAGEEVGGNVKEGAEEGVDNVIKGAKDAAKKVTGQDK